MKKLLITIILLNFLPLSFSKAADYITPIFYQLGADDSQIGHFMVGKTISDFCEESLEWEWWQSGLATSTIAYLKESLDNHQNPNSFNWKDFEWTCYGWVFRRFLTWKWEF